MPRAELAALAPAKRSEIRTPVLKSLPRLVVRQKSAAEQLDIPDEAPTDRSLFFVGLGLSHALQSQFGIATAHAAERSPALKPKKVAAKVPAPPIKKPVAVAVLANGPPQPPAAELDHSYPTSDAAPLPTASLPKSFSVYGVGEDDVLNMRSGPSEDYAIVGVIPPNGSGVRMVGGCIAVWCEIQFRNTRGWVNRYYLAQN
jgi:hypothetical protein